MKVCFLFNNIPTTIHTSAAEIAPDSGTLVSYELETTNTVKTANKESAYKKLPVIVNLFSFPNLYFRYSMLC